MEAIAITTIISATVVVSVVIFMFGSYLERHGPLNAWKKASMKGILNKGDTGRIVFVTPRGRLGATHVIVKTFENEVTDEIEVTISGKFDRRALQDLL